jgi:hypothetical protein
MASSATSINQPILDRADIDGFLADLGFYSPSKRELIEKHALQLISQYVVNKREQGVRFVAGEVGTPELHTHSIFILEINRRQLNDVGIIGDVMEKLYASFGQRMGLECVKLSANKPMPVYREFAYTKLADGKFCDIQNYAETTHVIINF